MPQISVIIPTYNRADIIARAIESVLAQDYQGFEIIVVDDGSTDGTKEILAPYIASAKIKYFFQANAGTARARNRGTAEATGEMLAFLDSDDEWLPNKLSEQLKLVEQYGPNILVCANTEYLDETGGKAGELFAKAVPSSGQVAAALLYDNFIATSTVMVSKKMFVAVGGFNERLDLKVGEDYELWLRIADRVPVYFLSQVLVRYHVHAKQSTSGQWKNKCEMIRLFWFIFLHSSQYENIKKSDIIKALGKRVFG